MTIKNKYIIIILLCILLIFVSCYCPKKVKYMTLDNGNPNHVFVDTACFWLCGFYDKDFSGKIQITPSEGDEVDIECLCIDKEIR